MTKVQYSLILTTFFEIVVRKIITEAFRFNFPGLGSFYLIKKKQEYFKDKTGKVRIHGSINWPATKKLQEETGDKSRKIYYINDHTDRYIYRIKWDKYNNMFTNKHWYKFILMRKHKQTLYKTIMSAVNNTLNAYKWMGTA